MDPGTLKFPADASISPPTDIFNIDKLPPDARRKIALDLDYDSIINLCNTRRALAELCEDPYFWRTKLKKDFPNVDISELDIETEGEKFRAKYELLLADKLWEEIGRIRRDSYENIKIKNLRETLEQKTQNLIDQGRYQSIDIEGPWDDDYGILARSKDLRVRSLFKDDYKELERLKRPYKKKIRKLENKIDKLNSIAREVYYS
jgi:hypothetical protein